MTSKPEDVADMKEGILTTAHSILAAGREIHPNLHLFLANGCMIPTVVAWDSTEEKHLYFDAFSRMIAALNPIIVAFSCEAWMAKKGKGRWIMVSPSEDPEREDTFFCLVHTHETQEFGHAPIITSGGKRSLGPMEWTESPRDTQGPLVEIFKQI